MCGMGEEQLETKMGLLRIQQQVITILIVNHVRQQT